MKCFVWQATHSWLQMKIGKSAHHLYAFILLCNIGSDNLSGACMKSRVNGKQARRLLMSLDMLHRIWKRKNKNKNASWIGRPIRADEKSISRRTRRVSTISRPPLESSRQGEFRSAGSIFLWSFFDLLIFKTSKIMVPTKRNPADLDSSRRIV